MSPCRKCEAKCCKYFAFQIDAPRRKADIENIRWYLAHKGVKVFIEKRRWYIEISNKCRYLTSEHACKIYHKRPLVCREHDAGSCEHIFDKFDHDRVFRNMKEFDLYLKEKAGKRKRKR